MNKYRGFTKEELESFFYLENGKLLWRVNPHIKPGYIGRIAGCEYGKGYRTVKLKQVSLLAHRIVFFIANGWLPEYIDHIDGDPSNNSPNNLRACTKTENAWNARKPSTNSSGYKGVGYEKRWKRWYARIRVNGVNYDLGLHKTPEEANESLIRFREQVHGEFANHG